MTGALLLTVDLGNTSGSLARVRAGAGPERVADWKAVAGADPSGDPGNAGNTRERDAIRAAITALRDADDRPARVALSAVGSHEREDAVVALLRELDLEVVAHPDPGLEFRIDRPETCGSDRKYAARGALALSDRDALLVVDAGTALTVDAVLRTPDGPCVGAFLGGAIALGPGSLAAALESAGARLPAVDLDPAAAALGRSTDGALRSGVVVGFRGAVRELAIGVANEAFGGADAMTVVLTGGALEYARAPLAELFPGRVVQDTALVHRGLAEAARGTAP